MKKKWLYYLLVIFGIFGLFYSLYTSNDKEAIFAEEDYDCIKVNNSLYNLPVTVYYGYYDSRADSAKVITNMSYYGKVDGKIMTHNLNMCITINNSTDLAKVNTYYNLNSLYTVDQDAWMTYKGNALSENFVILSSSSTLFTQETTLTSTTISGIKNAYSSVLDVIVPDDSSLPSDALVLTKRIDELSPVIEGSETLILTDYDDPITVNEIKSKLKAIDDTDGDISDRIILESDNYTNSNKTPGTYNVKFKVSDNANNTSTLSITIKVEEITPPTIDGPETLAATTSNPLDVEDLKELFTLTDNYDDSGDLAENFNIITDEYTTNKEKTGTYKVILKCTDSNSNSSQHTINITITDDTKPLISGTNQYTKGSTASLTLSKILEGLTATDNIDGDISKNITVKNDQYSSNATKVGSYTIICVVEDESGNESEDFIITVEVTDSQFPVFYVNGTFINISKYETMTKEDIINFLISTKVLKDTSITNVSWILDEYSGHEETLGEHKLSLKVNYEDKTEKYVSLTINVVDGNKTITQKPTNSETNETFFQRILTFIRKIAAKIATIISTITSFVKKIFSFNK